MYGVVVRGIGADVNSNICCLLAEKRYALVEEAKDRTRSSPACEATKCFPQARVGASPLQGCSAMLCMRRLSSLLVAQPLAARPTCPEA